MSTKTSVGISLLAVACFLMPNPSFGQSKPSFGLYTKPHRIVVHRNQPIRIKLILKNLTRTDAYIRLWLWPVPFGTLTDLHCLMLRCRNQATGKEVKYQWIPAIMSVADSQGKELPDRIPPHGYIVDPFDLREYCVLPAGKYVLELQYDTRYTPPWVKPDKRAWHGVTNKETIHIQVLK